MAVPLTEYYVTAEVMADMLSITLDNFDGLIRQGIIPKTKKYSGDTPIYPLAATIRMISFYNQVRIFGKGARANSSLERKDINRIIAKTTLGNNSITTDKTKLQLETERIQLLNEEQKITNDIAMGDLVSINEAIQANSIISQIIKDQIINLPTRISKKMTVRQQKTVKIKVQEEIEKILNSLSLYTKDGKN